MQFERDEVEFLLKVALFRGRCGKTTIPKAARVLVKNVLDGKRRRNVPVSPLAVCKTVTLEYIR